MFQLLPQNTNIQFVGKKSIFLYFSLAAIAVSLVIIAVMTPAWGIDFRGGTDIVLDFKKEVSVDQVRKAAIDAGFPYANVQTYGSGDRIQFLVQTMEVSVVNSDSIPTIQKNLEAIDGFSSANWDPTHPDRMDLTFSKEASHDALLAAVSSTGITGTKVDTSSNTDSSFFYTLKFEELSQKVRQGFTKTMGDAFDADNGIKRLETVGPRAGEQLRASAILSVIASLIMLLIYISIRFDFRYAPGAILALVHDVIICWAFLTFTQLDISLTTVAAMLTIIGYSLNDTIIIYDRIRENLVKEGSGNLVELVNKSTNETLSRTIITSGTTLLAVIALSIFATGDIQDFALTLVVGIIAGTLSTLFLATPLMVFMDQYIRNRRASSQILADTEEAV